MSNIADLKLNELVGQSDMTLGELITSYKQAPKKNLQLHALAELTLLPEDTIKALLLANGISYKELPRAKRTKHTVEVKPEDAEKFSQEAAPENFRGGVDETPPEPEPAAPQPSPLLDAVRGLVEHRNALAAELDEIDAQLAEMRRLLNMEGENRG